MGGLGGKTLSDRRFFRFFNKKIKNKKINAFIDIFMLKFLLLKIYFVNS